MFEKLIGRAPNYIDQEKYGRYAVLVPYLPESGALLFQVRSAKLHRQPGEICFPGGRIEAGEAPRDAAVRETQEELLVEKERIQVFAPLDILATPYYTIVYPYLGALSGYRFTFNQDEVAQVFTVPLEYFKKTKPQVYYNQITAVPETPDPIYSLLGVESYPWGTARSPVLFYQYEGWVIWGLTARFIQNLVELLRE